MTHSQIYFPNLHIYLESVGKNITIGGFTIAYYGMVIALGMLLGGSLVLRKAKKAGKDEDAYLDVVIFTVIFAVLGARIYYVIFAWDYYKNDLLSILNFRQGGLAIYGGIIGGIITAYIVTKIKRIPFLEFADFGILGVPVGQILGRWGNFFNREAFGQYTDGLFAMLIPTDAVRSSSDITTEMWNHIVVMDGVEYISVHPTFLYESIWNIGVLLLLLFLLKRKKYNGEIFFSYLLWYGVGRFWIESLRTDQLLLPNTEIPVSMVVAAVLVIISLIFHGIQIYKLKKS
ncbi:phosphatidylglycerol:prolipoprotein diacylglycerol transferase [Lachnospiraceae bacterium A10]|nr:phosphatidylglycerol:prolipoprotein diacylglycerol transferase [Lachnospiraceae bacterium A10]